jgi:membrane protease YdiL (CAAX protease family)
MPDDISDAPPSKPRSKGLLQPGHLLWARALPWGIVFAVVLWVVYKMAKGAAGDLGLGGAGPRILVPATLGVLAALALYVLSVRLIERRWPDELALARLGPELAVGLVLGAALFAAAMGVLLAIGAYALTGPTIAPAWKALAISLTSGVTEELIFRGVIFRLLWSTFGPWWALVLSSALFGVVHLGNPDSDLMAMLGIIFGAGVPLAALYILTGRLWAPIGYHMAWNFSQGYVFGAQVSGTSFGPSLYRAELVAGVDALWSGGAFGPEAALPTVILAGLAGAALLALATRRHT